MAIFARFRSKERDIETDVSRVLPIRDAVEAAIREAERELAGLRSRLAQASESAAFLFGAGAESEAGGDPGAEAELKRSETFLVRGQMRNRYLENQLQSLREVKSILDRIAQPKTDWPADGS